MAKGSKAGHSRRDQLRAQAKKAKRAEKRTMGSTRPSHSVNIGPAPPREVLPVEGVSADDYIQSVVATSPRAVALLRAIRSAKRNGTRPLPSTRLHLGAVSAPDEATCRGLVDQVATLVDENLFGRSDMCLQFASLLALALKELEIEAVAFTGEAKYRRDDGEWFSWNHAWVRYGDVVIDANVDTMRENPVVPKGLDPAPFWGPLAECPADREFEVEPEVLAPDSDVEQWWQRLRAQLRRKSVERSSSTQGEATS